ncbi:hypothetical protein ISD98_02530 [Pseudomonas aeruginosa]|nr:hypothetical protein [Pseudomonas aeruginosa]MDI3921813.1 hypothetical protein [Pseudomonas aeruginosa]
MKGLEGRPLVGVRMASIPPAKIPISTLKSRFTFGLRPPLLKKVPHTKQVLGIFRICSTKSVGVGSHTPTSKFIAVRLEKATGDGRII